MLSQKLCQCTLSKEGEVVAERVEEDVEALRGGA
jgi:predicted RNA-binding protein